MLVIQIINSADEYVGFRQSINDDENILTFIRGEERLRLVHINLTCILNLLLLDLDLILELHLDEVLLHLSELLHFNPNDFLSLEEWIWATQVALGNVVVVVTVEDDSLPNESFLLFLGLYDRFIELDKFDGDRHGWRGVATAWWRREAAAWGRREAAHAWRWR